MPGAAHENALSEQEGDGAQPGIQKDQARRGEAQEVRREDDSGHGGRQPARDHRGFVEESGPAGQPVDAANEKDGHRQRNEERRPPVEGREGLPIRPPNGATHLQLITEEVRDPERHPNERDVGEPVAEAATSLKRRRDSLASPGRARGADASECLR